MDKIREIVAEMKLEEDTLLKERLGNAQLAMTRISQLTSTGSVALIIFISVIALLMLGGTRAYLSNTKITETELTHLATHDSLTKLYNRRSLEARLNYAIDTASRYQHPLSIIMLDLDHFKNINDTFGHKAGDILLETIGAILGNSVRKSDTVARYGGEEFVIIIIETPLAEANEFAEELRKIIAEQSIRLDGGEDISITASLGVTSFPDHSKSSQKLLEKADSAMYMAKAAGRNQIKTFKPS